MKILTKKWMPGSKKCHCGGRAWTIHYIDGFLKVWCLRCSECSNRSPAYLSDNEALKAWNRAYHLQSVDTED